MMMSACANDKGQTTKEDEEEETTCNEKRKEGSDRARVRLITICSVDANLLFFSVWSVGKGQTRLALSFKLRKMSVGYNGYHMVKGENSLSIPPSLSLSPCASLTQWSNNNSQQLKKKLFHCVSAASVISP
jgi:hypothetical protein